MLLSDLLQVLNASNIVVNIREESENGTKYIYMGKLKSRSQIKEVIEKYGKRKVREVNTHINIGKLLNIAIEREEK